MSEAPLSDFAPGPPTSRTAGPAQPAGQGHVHSVRFYRDDESLIETVAAFARVGLERNEAVVVIATAAHNDAVRRALVEQVGGALGPAIESGTLVFRDAGQTISAFLREGLPDEHLFREAICPLLDSAAAAAPAGRVRAYGEMVDVLWQAGNGAAVVRLEQLWQEIVRERPVELLCGYRFAAFAGRENAAAFRQVCDLHRWVVPAGSWAGMSEADKFRAWADAEQRAASLAVQAELRARAEAARERLVADLEQQRRDSAVLLALSEAASRANAPADLFEPTLDAACSALGVDRAAILLFDADDVMRFQAWRGLSDEYRRTVEGHSPWARTESNPRPIFVEDVHADESLSAYGPLFDEEGIGALGFVPLMQQGRLLGKFMVYAPGPRTFSVREVRLATSIASQASQAVARAALLERERIARDSAERTAARTARLQAVTAALATASSVKDACDALVLDGVAALAAATGGLWLTDEAGEHAELVRSFAYSETAQFVTRLRLDSPMPLPVLDVIRSGEPVWLTCREQFAQRYPQIAAMVKRPELSVACLPLVVEGRCLGGLAFTFDEVRSFPDDEKNFLLVLARHCAQALARARLLDGERAARQRAEAAELRSGFLLEASARLSASLNYQEALAQLGELAVPRVCDWFAVELCLDPNEPSQQLTVVHTDPRKVELVKESRRRYPPRADASHGVAHVLRTGKPELHEDIPPELIESLAQDGEHLRLLRSLQVRSLIVVPMVARGKTFGAITLAMAESGRTYRREDLDLAELLGRRAGIAIDNARLYEEAQRATRAREEILAVVSHDLRNPLAGILMGAANLLRVEITERTAPRVRKFAEAINRSAEHMSRLIQDLGDYSSIQTGSLHIDPCPCKVPEIVEETATMFAAQAAERGVQLRTNLADHAIPDVHCDHDRVVQALGNLVSNAIKVSAPGGAVELGARVDGRHVEIYVADEGPGIPADELPRLFERYWRGAAGGQYRGRGLGLTIAKGIAEAHRGRIEVVSTVGRGSRFTLALPLPAGVQVDPA